MWKDGKTQKDGKIGQAGKMGKVGKLGKVGKMGRVRGMLKFRTSKTSFPWAKVVVAAVSVTIIFQGGLNAQKKWDGEGNDGLWSNPLNWIGNLLPVFTDDVIFDNSSVTGNYQVSIGAGQATAIVRSVVISPSVGRNIQVIIPPDNTASPALASAGAVYGLTIGTGGVFINSSGASAGSTFVITDSIRINNGGRYVHATARSHADNVRVLSRAAGTEEGEFEFSIPVASSTISVSGQVFGKLRLSPGPGGIINYTGTGTNGLVIRSDLEIANGVNLSFNLEARLEVGRDLRHDGGILNLGSTARNLQVILGGNMKVGPASSITESGTAQPAIILDGPRPAQIDVRGTISNEVGFEINKAAPAELLHDLTLPFQLRLVNGIINTNEFTLLLADHAMILQPADPSKSFINGRLRKAGLENEDFLFPVGKDGSVRWVGLKNATGNFLIEYRKSDPRLLASKLAMGINHISGIEYWSITADGPQNTASPEISFDNVNSGGVTDLGQLRVARLIGDTWQNLGNLATTGSAGAIGSVTGSVVTDWSQGQPALFTLASSVATQNPLPLIWKRFSVRNRNDYTLLEWSTDLSDVAYFELQTSTSGVGFLKLASIPFNTFLPGYSYRDYRITGNPKFYRVVMVKNDSSRINSKVVSTVYIPFITNNIVSAVADAGVLRLHFSEPVPAGTRVTIFDLAGRELVCAGSRNSFAGMVTLQLACRLPRSQVVLVRINYADGSIAATRLFVR